MKAWELLALLLCLAATTVRVAHADEDQDEALVEDEDMDEHHRVARQISFGGGSSSSSSSSSSSAGGCNCQPIVVCPTAISSNLQACALPNNQQGVCCPVQSAASSSAATRILTQPRLNAGVLNLNPQQINSACQKGLQDVRQLNSIAHNLASKGIQLRRGTPASGHQRVFQINRGAAQMHKSGKAIEQASKNLMKDHNLNAVQGGHGLQAFSVRNSILSQACPTPPRCDPNYKYRTITGVCNNLRNTMYGSSNTAFQRVLPPKYKDGISAIRDTSVNGSPLQSPRVIASTVLVDFDQPNQAYTLSVMQWAQFMDHDITHAPFESLENGEGVECCENGREIAPELRHPECAPIFIPPTDQFYATRGQSCMNFVRSMTAPNQQCTFGFREQVNQLTHWIDGSNIYGSTPEEFEGVRGTRPRDGLLRTSGNNFLPENPVEVGDCQASQRGARCFIAGDSRVNEQPGLTAMHVVWLREHNRIARIMKQLHPRWNDQQLFEETRRIVIAEYQHITYNEWLPIILGPSFMTSFQIGARQFGHSFDYLPNVNPNMNNEFITAAFRFGHTLVQGFLQIFDANNRASTIKMRDHFNSPHLVARPGLLDGLLRGMTRQASQNFDSFVTEDLSNHLFQTPRDNFGMDLMSLNIARGRDHAIATYNEIREICGLPRARTFAEFGDHIPPQIIERFRRIYAHVDDVDFFVGGLSERPVSGGLLGWTFLCVVGDQFARLRKADRFFYDLGGQAGSFNEVQLGEIRKSSWSRIICDNSDGIQVIQPLSFRLPDGGFNQLVRCDGPQIPRVDLRAWARESPGV
ncbi:salivary peroxidase/catechol oxidase-like [Oratosquilla oratoria]|uniref:salivary peroxidase/catechol oxidase-like n=1 Tax=Oratosquilla oratoria TaxID=337810 RepID=UPI003F75E21F